MKKETLGCLLIVLLVTSAFICIGTGVALLAIKFMTYPAIKWTCIATFILTIAVTFVVSVTYNKPRYYEPDSGSDVQ